MAEASSVVRTSVDGTTLLTLTDRSLPVVWYTVTTLTAAAGDPSGKSGRARAAWELVFRGTERRSWHEFAVAVERLGAQLSTSVGYELASVRGSTLSRHAGRTLELVAEALCTPALAEDERVPLLEELAEDVRNDADDDGTLADEMLRRLVAKDQPQARPAKGLSTQLVELTGADLRQGYEGLVGRGGLVVAMAGDLSADDAAQLITPLTRGLPKQTPPPLGVARPARPEALRIVLVDKPERSQVQLRVGTPGLPWSHPDALALWLGITTFGGTFTSPLCREVRDVRGWSYTASAVHQRRRRLPPIVTLRSAPANADAVDCLELELELFFGLGRGELAADSLSLTRDYLTHRHPFEVASADDLLMPLIMNEAAGVPLDEPWTWPAALARTSDDAVRAALGRHLVPGAAGVVLVASAGDVEPELRRRFPEARLEVVDYRDELALL